MSIPSPPASWASFQVGIFTIHSYAICILVGILAASLITGRRIKARGALGPHFATGASAEFSFQGDAGVVIDIGLPAVAFGLIGARLYHVFTHVGDYFGPGHPFWEIFAIWEGGNAIFGTLLGGAIGVWLGCRWTGIRFLSFADAVAPGLLVAQAIGRIGNWFNTELYGLPTNLPWGLQVPSTNAAFPTGLPDGTLFHPTFLYELIWDLAGAGLLILIERKGVLRGPSTGGAMRWGRAFGFYLLWYGAGRSVFESIRIDPTEVFFGLRVNVWAAFGAMLLGIILLLASRRHVGQEPSIYRPGREWSGKGTVESVYTEADFAEDTAKPVDATTSSVPPGR